MGKQEGPQSRDHHKVPPRSNKVLLLIFNRYCSFSFLLFPPWCCGTEDVQYSLLNTALGCAPLVNLQHVKSTSESSQPISSMDQIIQWLFCSSNYRALTNPENTTGNQIPTLLKQPLNQTYPFCRGDPI